MCGTASSAYPLSSNMLRTASYRSMNRNSFLIICSGFKFSLTATSKITSNTICKSIHMLLMSILIAILVRKKNLDLTSLRP
ncbi:hypothetical protein D8674_008840 [Pyrus ussuriensis x Pyrus communis]|uniref:Uncharacterized protein n=1 Tax=Pyrus ussuriensis x Pyrus communis TaxID=2448454 RepID=A0A5N5HYR0_9ROSA|nr:hypothetical protein D8674_008840 [Pyrus ussuriensis x Pyrus communis]